VATRFFASAKKVLKRWPQYYEQLVTHGEPLPDENRHEYMIAMFGSIVPALIRKSYAKIEDIFALVYDPICGWDMSTCKVDPHENVWEALQHVFSIEAEKYNDEEEQRAAEQEAGLSTIENMVRGMRLWCDAPELAIDAPADKAQAFVLRHLMANIGREYFPLNKWGQYEKSSILREQVISYIRTSHLDTMIQTRTQDANVPYAQIVDEYSTIVHKVTYLPECKEQGIRLIDSPGSELFLPMYRRSPFVKAQYSVEVDGWLRCFFGDHYEKAIRWIGYALAFEEGPICALSITGPPDTGKKLLVVGLSECLEDPYVIPGVQIGASHAEGLLRSPFIHVNESWPHMQTHNSPSDRFKELTAGDPVHVDPKFKSPVQAKNPFRVIFTANNHDLIYGLTRGRDLKPEDKAAIGQRLFHVDIDDQAGKYLQSLGGRDYTSQHGRRWISGDSGEVSDHIVAGHFMWLYENRPPKDRSEGDRLCVMGNCGSESNEMFSMAAQSDNFPVVVRAIKALQQSKMSVFCVQEEGRVFVTRGGVLKMIQDNFKERIQERSLETVLDSVAVSSGSVERDGREYVEIDMGVVGRYCRKWGL
jgi:hypothetical protein